MEIIEKKFEYGIKYGYYDKDNYFIFHNINDEPAIIYDNGSTFWYKHGKYHRDNDKPAVEYADGYKAWYKEGKRHRETGPAIIRYNEEKQYWLNGILYKNIKTDEEWIIKQILE